MGNTTIVLLYGLFGYSCDGKCGVHGCNQQSRDLVYVVDNMVYMSIINNIYQYDLACANMCSVQQLGDPEAHTWNRTATTQLQYKTNT